MSEASDQITEYLSVGGLFNPEMMNQTQHEAVRDTLIKARDDIQRLERWNAALREQVEELDAKWKMAEDQCFDQVGKIGELERENAELRAHAERVGQANDRLAVENDALRGELDFWRDGSIVREEDKKELIALRKELDWKTERLRLLSKCLHNIDGLFGEAVTSVFVDALDAARKEAQQ